jgi:hypothetical protein
MSTAATVRALKANDEDFEYYPSTSEIIDTVVSDICRDIAEHHYTRTEMKSVLDIGAGDGRVLKAIQKGVGTQTSIGQYGALHKRHIDCYAIEKAMYHLSNMPKDITVVGTDFEQQSLADKPMDAIFCNPPYSEFTQWTLKIIREASARLIYLVIPRRWRESVEISRALKARSGEVTSLGEFDFHDADRRANAKVEIIRIEYKYSQRDAFDSVIEDMMPELDVFDAELEEEAASTINRELFNAGQNLVEVLVDSYDRDLMTMLANYKAALSINIHVLKELGVCKDGMLKAIWLKIKGLKDHYWKTLFNEMATITQRLATKQRAAFLQSLKDKVSIDFTCNNVYSILIWVSKWANDYMDEQLIDLFRTLSTDSCVIKYKSNDRVWTKGRWRYQEQRVDFSSDDKAVSHYKLEYRIVLTHGGIKTSHYSWEKGVGFGLEESSMNMLCDIITAANNLGFACKDNPRNYEWVSNKQNTLMLNDGTPLVAVRAFKNGNMHMHFNPKVMLAINVEAGRLLKWIRNPAEACEEMQVKGEEAKQVAAMFGSSFRIGPDAGFLKLTGS